MIATLKRRLKLEMLKSEIRSMESHLVAIAKQRRNDNEAEKIIGRELAVARRQMQALNQDEINKITAANVRRMGS